MDLSKLKAGNAVRMEGDVYGRVAFSSFSDSYSEKFPKADWPDEDYAGIMIEQDNGVLIFYPSDCLLDGQVSVEVDSTS